MGIKKTIKFERLERRTSLGENKRIKDSRGKILFKFPLKENNIQIRSKYFFHDKRNLYNVKKNEAQSNASF